MIECPNCEGSGTIWCDYCGDPEHAGQCSQCFGEGKIPYIMCRADMLGSSALCTLAEGHNGWHEEWLIEDDGSFHKAAEWKYTREEERNLRFNEIYNSPYYPDKDEGRV